MNKDKWLSGRWIFTVVTAIVYAWASITKALPTDKISEIIMLVIIFYFSRTDRNQPKTGGGA